MLVVSHHYKLLDFWVHALVTETNYEMEFVGAYQSMRARTIDGGISSLIWFRGAVTPIKDERAITFNLIRFRGVVWPWFGPSGYGLNEVAALSIITEL